MNHLDKAAGFKKAAIFSSFKYWTRNPIVVPVLDATETKGAVRTVKQLKLLLHYGEQFFWEAIQGEECELIPTPTTPDGHETNKGAVLRGIVLDCRSGQDAEVKVYECYCFQTRQLMVIKTSRGLCKSWEITFSIKSRDDNGICDVNIEKVSENSPMETKGEVVLGRDGAVRIRTYVGASECPQHESYDEKILWSDKFQRVRRGQDDGPLEKSAIYSTYVERDTSKEAIAKGVAFRISDLLKKVIDEDTIKRCQDQMLADQDILNAEANSSTDAFGNVEQPVRELLTATLLMNKLEIKDKDEVFHGVILDVCQAPDGAHVFECFCFDQKKLLRIRTDEGLCKSWRVTFTIKNTNSDGVYDVNIAKKDGNPPDAEKGDIFLSRDGFVIMKTYVGASMCIHHESHEGIVLWSDKFGRVLYANEEKLATTTIYSTYVRRDGSRLAASYAVEFRICETLKPVADKDVVQRCQIQLFEDQDRLFAKITSAKKKVEKESEENRPVIGQKGFGVDEGPYSARIYNNSEVRKRGKFKFRRGHAAPLPQSNQRNLMLCIRADKIKTKAWNAEYGCILVEETYVKQTGSKLKRGDWFYANIRSRETESGLFFYVKRVDEPADPLAYTYWVRDILQIELQLDISLVEKLANGMVIAENPYVGKIEMEQEAYDMISSQRMVGTLRFNDFNKEVPWTFVEIIRTLEPREDFPISSPECRVSDHVRTRAKNESRRPPSSRSDRYRPHPNASAQYRPQSSGSYQGHSTVTDQQWPQSSRADEYRPHSNRNYQDRPQSSRADHYRPLSNGNYQSRPQSNLTDEYRPQSSRADQYWPHSNGSYQYRPHSNGSYPGQPHSTASDQYRTQSSRADQYRPYSSGSDRSRPHSTVSDQQWPQSSSTTVNSRYEIN